MATEEPKATAEESTTTVEEPTTATETSGATTETEATADEPVAVVKGPHTSLWRIDVRQVVYTALGIALYAVLNIIFNFVQLPNAGGGAIAFRPGIVIPLLFGGLFGPSVGLLVGGLGNIISDLISYHSFYWNWDVGNALIGLITGLVVIYTAGRYRRKRAIIFAEVASFIAIVVGLAFASYTDVWVSKISFGAATGEFLIAAIPDLINGLILLPILLVAYNAAIRQRGRA
jgi:Predicted membrane protein